MVSKCWRGCILGVTGCVTLLHGYIVNGQSLCHLPRVIAIKRKNTITTGLLADENIEVLLLH
jgi:hypothetical protein